MRALSQYDRFGIQLTEPQAQEVVRELRGPSVLTGESSALLIDLSMRRLSPTANSTAFVDLPVLQT